MFLVAATNAVSLHSEDSITKEDNFDKGISPRFLYSISDTFISSILISDDSHLNAPDQMIFFRRSDSN